jgi:ketosteroid isomerase-like protein
VAGSDSCAETSKSGGQVRSWKGRFLTVYQQQPDGSWMIVRDSGAEDRPPERPQPPPVAL